MDIILGGNDYDFRPQFSRLDADYGSVLLNDGKEGFQWQDYEKTGFFIKEEIKHIQQFKDAQGRAYVIVAINNEKPRVYKMGE